MSDATPPADVSAKPPRRFRRLRVAVSVTFSVIAVALCIWWHGAIHVNKGFNQFGLGDDPRSLDVYVLIAFLSLVVAGAPWYFNLPRRFSLRTLLVTTALVAVVLGLGVWLVL
jgi:hypothetical protein